MRFTRITIDPYQMGGVACIRGLRIPVATIVGALAEGMNPETILTHYPDLEQPTSAKPCSLSQKRCKSVNCR